MADVQEVRRTNLRHLVTEHEGMGKLAKKLGLAKGAYISQLLTEPPVRTISEKSVRKWEKILSLPEGWMDGEPRRYGGQATGATINTALLTQVISAVTEALKAAKVDLPTAKVSDLVALSYSDALALGRVDTDRLQTLVGLLKR
jgi:hypothetical protein